MTDLKTSPSTVKRHLTDLAATLSPYDPDLADHLTDLASEYALPSPVNPQVSDEEWQRQQEMA